MKIFYQFIIVFPQNIISGEVIYNVLLLLFLLICFSMRENIKGDIKLLDNAIGCLLIYD